MKREPTLAVLIIDGDTDSRVVLRVTLAARGCRVLEVSGEQEGIDRIPTHDPALIFYEWWRLPDDRGAGLATRLRAASPRSRRDMMIVALSSQDEPEGFTGIEDIDAYITKPYRIEWIETLIPRALGIRLPPLRKPQ